MFHLIPVFSYPSTTIIIPWIQPEGISPHRDRYLPRHFTTCAADQRCPPQATVHLQTFCRFSKFNGKINCDIICSVISGFCFFYRWNYKCYMSFERGLNSYFAFLALCYEVPVLVRFPVYSTNWPQLNHGKYSSFFICTILFFFYAYCFFIFDFEIFQIYFNFINQVESATTSAPRRLSFSYIFYFLFYRFVVFYGII